MTPRVRASECIVLDVSLLLTTYSLKNSWSLKRKWGAMSVIAAFVFISPVSSSMMAPAAAVIAKEFGVTNSTVVAMLTSIFVLAYAFGPLFLGPLSEVYGRSKVLQYGNIMYLSELSDEGSLHLVS